MVLRRYARCARSELFPDPLSPRRTMPREESEGAPHGAIMLRDESSSKVCHSRSGDMVEEKEEEREEEEREEGERGLVGGENTAEDDLERDGGDAGEVGGTGERMSKEEEACMLRLVSARRGERDRRAWCKASSPTRNGMYVLDTHRQRHK